jgi:hypothetical protein
VTSLYEHARADEALHGFEEMFSSKLLTDPLLQSLFTDRLGRIASIT